MGIINAITSGRTASWLTADSTSASTASALVFSVDKEPSEWAVFKKSSISNSTSTGIIAYITKAGASYAGFGLWKNGPFVFGKTGNCTPSYSSGTFTVTAGADNFGTTAGDYILFYI